MSEFRFKLMDRDGGVELEKQDQIVMVKLVGACGNDVIDYYIEKLQLIARTYAGEPWGYFCNSKEFHATTPEAHQKIIANYRACMQLGCRYDAYCYNSPVGIAQTENIRKECGVNSPICKVLFDDPQQATEFLKSKLETLPI